MADVTVLGAPWCPDCRRTKRFLAEQRVSYDWVDIDKDPAGLRRVEEIQKGGRTIPTVVFADGSVLVDPENEELARKLGLALEPQPDVRPRHRGRGAGRARRRHLRRA